MTRTTVTGSTRKFAAIVLGGVFALSAVTFADFIHCAFADDTPAPATSAPATNAPATNAPPTNGPATGTPASGAVASTLLPIANEPAPKLTVAAPLPGPLARGAVLVPYKVENLRILPVLGAAADDVSPRVGHLHVTVDDLPWHWGEFSNDGTIVVVGLPAGPHKLLIELASPEHHIYSGQTVSFTVPDAAAHAHG